MKVSGFSYVRNGFQNDYPFLESIRSVLPICDEFIMVVGDSTDGTREAIEAIGDPKIKIVDSVWSEQMRQKGKIFAEQANLGLDQVTGDWAFHIQADEVVHENDLPKIKAAMEQYLHDEKVEGFLFHFINFFGDYKHYGPSRRFHNKEIRIVRNSKNIRSYRDSQGFRRYIDPSNQDGEKGFKLHVKALEATVYHYSYVKSPAMQYKKQREFVKHWIKDDAELEKYMEKWQGEYDYNEVDVLAEFKGTHPKVMQEKIARQDWAFRYDPSKSNMKFKEKILYFIQKLTNKQLFTYKNYKII